MLAYESNPLNTHLAEINDKCDACMPLVEHIKEKYGELG
jgi:hypothetical protein